MATSGTGDSDAAIRVPAMTIRPATVDDLPAIRRIGEITWPATYTFASADYIRESLDRWWSDEALLRSIADTHLVVAQVGDEVMGVGNRDDSGPVPIIWKLYVLPDRHGSGIGTALLNTLIASAPAAAEAVQLEYLDGNGSAAGFYASRGFTEIRREPGERPGWPGAVWMELRLPVRG